MKYNFKTELKFTETYKRYKNDNPAIREAMCLKSQYPDYFSEMHEGDLFAGRIKHGLVGFSPDEWGPTAFGYYILNEKIDLMIADNEVADDVLLDVKEMQEFWKTENTSARLRSSYPAEMSKYLPSDDWMNDSGIAFPLYRLTGGTIDFHKLMKLGIPGLRDEIKFYRKRNYLNNKKAEFYDAALIALEVLDSICILYANEAEQKISEADRVDAERYSEIALVLNAIRFSPPKTFREGLQLFWLYSLAADVRNYGRMDIYMGDLLANDIKAGILSESDALELLQSLWRLMADRKTVVHNRVIIGGKGRPNEENADLFATLAMEATRTVKEPEPQLSLRIYNGMDENVYNKALEVISEGRTYPILYNDDVNIDAVSDAFGFDNKEAQQYTPYGCGEYILEHRSFGTPSGVINLLKALEVTLNNGLDPVTKKKMGLALGEFADFKKFEDLWDAYTRQVEHYVRIMADHEALEYKVAGESAPFLFMSMLYDNCIHKGKGIFSGGIKYLGGTLETYGNTNTADSLLAIKNMVYDDKSISVQELLNALNNNFDGYEGLRNKLLNVPKYGNDDSAADEMLIKVHNHICEYTKEQKRRAGLHSYLVVIINNSANTLMGRSTSASADGRLSGKSMNNGNTPASGNDRKGVTALLNSLVKPSTKIHAGAVQNLKFSKEMFSSKLPQLKALLKTYFNRGGAQAMITVIDKGELEKALENPEECRNLIVRVGGFSARFVELSRDIQMDILQRTLY